MSQLFLVGNLLSSSLSKATMTHIYILKSNTKSHSLSKLLTSATLPSKSSIASCRIQREYGNISPKKLFKSTSTINPTNNDNSPEKDRNESSIKECRQQSHGVNFLPSFLTQTIDTNNENNRLILSQENKKPHMNDIEYTTSKPLTPPMKKRKHTEGFLLQELHSLRNQTEQDLVKL